MRPDDVVVSPALEEEENDGKFQLSRRGNEFPNDTLSPRLEKGQVVRRRLRDGAEEQR